MIAKLLWSLVLLLARMLAHDTVWCDAADAMKTEHATQPLPYSVIDHVHHATLLGENAIIVSGRDFDRRLTLATPRGDEILASFTMRRTLGGEALVVREDSWWYGAITAREGGVATTFVRSDSSGRIESVAVPAVGRSPYFWIPVRGDEPYGLQLAFGDERWMLVTEVHGRGVGRSWQLPPVNRLLGSYSAERLPDGRIVLFAIDARAADLEWVTLDDTPRVEPAVLRAGRYSQLATAINAQGQIVVAVADLVTAGEDSIDVTVVDVDRPSAAVWHRVATDASLSAQRGELQVAMAADRAIVAWANRGATARLRARELLQNRMGATAVTIADLSGDPVLFFACRPEEENVRFLWHDGRRLQTRTMPVSLSGYDLVESLDRVFCPEGR